MSLQFILGPPGTGKTFFCLNEIEAALSGDRPLYYLVPEQFSLQSEKLLLQNRTATTRVQVLSFNRLAYRLFAALGGPPGQTLDDLGKHMLLRKVLLELADELVFYKRSVDKHGFVHSLAATITELNHYCISSEDLRLRSEQMGPTLGAKLQDLALIVARYRAAISGKYLPADDMLDLLVQQLAGIDGDIRPLAGAMIWADGFSGFTPQERQVLLHLMKNGVDIKITLTTRERPLTATQDPLFTTPRETVKKLTALATRANIAVAPPIYLKQNHRHAHDSGLAFFAQNFTMRVHSGAAATAYNDIEILSAPERYNAVYAAAHKILTWVNAGHRFRDIAIVCGNRGHYEKTLTTAFERLGIPLFVDTEVDILSHPLTELIRAALSILVHNWNYEAVFRFLKTGLTGLDMDTIDILENFALAHGISGYKWQYPFISSGAASPAEMGRVYLQDALSVFGSAGSKDTIKGFCHKVFKMLYDLQVPQTLEHLFDQRMASNDPATARMHKQVWPKICEVFDKLVEILGDEKVNLDTFASILDAGLNQVGLGRIPPTVDQVILGDMGRSRYPQIKAMLVLGANEGSFPPIATSPGLFSEDERRHLQNTDIELAPDNLARINDQYYALYCTLSQPSSQLTFIYAQGEPSGAVLRPSHVLRRVQALLGQHTAKAPLLREYDPIPVADALPPILASASDIYGQTFITAASRLEAFARCPFAYFMNYLLLARPRQRHQVLPTDLGSLYHDVLARFTNSVAAGEIDANNLDRNMINGIAGQLIAELTPEGLAFHASARNHHILSKAESICAASIWALCEHIKRGQFIPIGAELGFGLGEGMAESRLGPAESRLGPAESQLGLAKSQFGLTKGLMLENGRNLILTGRIDRVDLLKGNNQEQYVRIIDYKSGAARFDIAEVEQGTQLQLMLYMDALIKNPNALAKYPAAIEGQLPFSAAMPTHPAGIFYFPINDPIIDTDSDLTATALDEALLKRFRLSGVALASDTILSGMDKGLAPGLDSSIIPVKMNKDGRLAKTSKPTMLEPEAFAQLAQTAEDKVKELAMRMTNGDIAAKPCNSGINSPCRYCNYDTICGRS
ncbi:MAG: PD-(D/E)XK nuclease family protein [Defluviitaleaceae bacterium]|nr:PD-(D/E)XK nuclease family protein [Defluviitaleaceae bacterium]